MDATNFFASASHANDYLSNSIILLDGQPIVVRSVSGDNNIVYDMLKGYGGDSRSRRVGLHNKGLYFGTVPLGYAREGDSGCVRLGRSPSRQWKVGITRNTVRRCVAGMGLSDTGGRIYFEDTGLYDCIAGIYPDPDEAVKKLDPMVCLATPLTRELALQCNAPSEPGVRLIHHGSNNVVGFLKKGTVLLRPDRFYLIESLQAMGFTCEVGDA